MKTDSFPVNYETIRQLEPRLAEAESLAAVCDPDDWRAWVAIKRHIECLVGFWSGSEHPELWTSAAYNVVYDNLRAIVERNGGQVE